MHTKPPDSLANAAFIHLKPFSSNPTILRTTERYSLLPFVLSFGNLISFGPEARDRLGTLFEPHYTPCDGHTCPTSTANTARE